MATTTTPAPETPPADVVTAKQFGDLSTKVDSLATSIQTLVEAQKSAPTPPANGGQLGVADQIAAAQLAEKKRFLDILDLANTAGIKDANKHAREWVDKGLSIDQAKAAITDLNIAQNKLTPDSGQPNPETDSALRREYRANLAAFQKQGVSEDDYVEIQKSLAETGGV